jgi:hypothetical protein
VALSHRNRYGERRNEIAGTGTGFDWRRISCALAKKHGASARTTAWVHASSLTDAPITVRR